MGIPATRADTVAGNDVARLNLTAKKTSLDASADSSDVQPAHAITDAITYRRARAAAKDTHRKKKSLTLYFRYLSIH